MQEEKERFFKKLNGIRKKEVDYEKNKDNAENVKIFLCNEPKLEPYAT